MTSEQQEKTVLKKSYRRHVLITTILLLSAVGFVLLLNQGLNLDQGQIPSVLLNKPAHNFNVSWLQGRDLIEHQSEEHFTLDDFRGRPMILNFWASWCFSCRAEARDFEEFWNRYKDSGLIVAGIAIQDTPMAARAFAKQYGKTYILGLDDDGSAAIDYGVTGVPETFVIDRKGNIVYKEAGPMTAQKLAEVAKLIL